MSATTFTQPSGVDPVAEAYVTVIKAHSANAPRSLQTKVGPSEMGQTCARRTGHRILGTPPVNTGGDGWLPTIGTAVHAWLADAFTAENARLGRTRYYVETRVPIDDDLTIHGSCDLFDDDEQKVNDWKIVGKTTLDKARRGEVRPAYRAQAHLYGRGFTVLGQQIRTVSITYLPRNGPLTDTVVWSEPYDQAYADQVLERFTNIESLTRQLGAAILPAAPSRDCLYCPYYAPRSTDLTTACPGDLPG